MTQPERRRGKYVTLTEIASACGVATSTVSRALSNPNRVSAAMYERVVSAAKELGYHSALLAPIQNTASRGTIALMLPNLSNPFVLDIVRGCQAQAQAAGYRHLLVCSDESVKVESDWLNELAATVDGIVLSSPRSSDDVLRAVSDRVPMVVVNRDVPWLSSVIMDTPAGVAQALEYLVSLGHRSIAHVRGPDGSWTDQQRHKAAQAAAQRLGVTCRSVGHFYPSLVSGAAAADAVALTGATAALFFNDMLAIGALVRFEELGMSVPDDISVVGCDDIFGASFSSPPLTTVTSSGERAGHRATDLLIGSLDGAETVHHVVKIPAHLTVRTSTGPARQVSAQAQTGV